MVNLTAYGKRIHTTVLLRTIKVLIVMIVITSLGLLTGCDHRTYTIQEKTVPQQRISRRVTVVSLLNKANTLLHDTAQPSRFADVGALLEQAYAQDPHRLDILFSAASAWISTNEITKALLLYDKILSVEPDNIDALIYQAAWNRYLHRSTACQHFVHLLEHKDPYSAKKLKHVFFIIDSTVHEPILTQLPAYYTHSNVAIIALGYALNPDGSMQPVLIDRLKTAQQLAQQIPKSTIIPTGGNVRAGESEGENMTDWLEEHGIDSHRIQEENFAQDTLGNALYSMPIIAESHAKNIIIVSSANHVRRAQVIFSIAAAGRLTPDTSFTTIATQHPAPAPPTTDEIRSIYRDALRSMGLWSYRSAPLMYW